MRSHQTDVQYDSELQAIEAQLRMLLRQPELEVRTPNDIKVMLKVIAHIRSELDRQQAQAKRMVDWALTSTRLKKKYPDKREVCTSDYSCYGLEEPIEYYQAHHNFWKRNLENVDADIRGLEIAKTHLKYMK